MSGNYGQSGYQGGDDCSIIISSNISYTSIDSSFFIAGYDRDQSNRGQYDDYGNRKAKTQYGGQGDDTQGYGGRDQCIIPLIRSVSGVEC